MKKIECYLIVFYIGVFYLALGSLAFAGDFPNKCQKGFIIKRDLLTSTGSSSPLPRQDRHYGENKIDVKINNGKYKYSYKHCWGDGSCQWIDATWSRLGNSNHGQLHTKGGFSAFFGTMENSNSFYVCWFRK